MSIIRDVLSLGSSRRTKRNRVFLDIVAFLSIIFFITGLLGLFGIQIKFLNYIFFKQLHH